MKRNRITVTFIVIVCLVVLLRLYIVHRVNMSASLTDAHPKKLLMTVQRKVTFFKLKNNPLYIISAYADFRLGHVRLVGMASHNNYKGVSCTISHSNGTIQTVPATIQYLPEGHGLKYDAIYVLCKNVCPLSSGTTVGLRDHHNKTSFFIPVQIIPRMSSNPAQGMTVCYPPLHSGYDNVEQFLENIEMNRILGFRQFFVYVYNVGPRVRRAIDSYAKEGIVHVVSWEAFPLVSGSDYPVPKSYEIHYLGQMVAINDCLYRAMNRPFRVVAFHDFDELIIPRQSWSLSDIVMKAMDPAVTGLSVRCAVFNSQFVVNNNTTLASSKNSLRLQTQLQTRRLKRLFPHEDRSKMLVAADKVITMGIHFVWRKYTGHALHVNADVALLHHYRYWEKSTDVVDETALKYGQILKSNIMRRLQQLSLK